MSIEINYAGLFGQALSRIKSVRAPHAERPENKDLQWDIVRKQILFDFGGEDYEKSATVYNAAKEISIGCLHFMITQLINKYKVSLETVSRSAYEDKKVFDGKIHFALLDSSSNSLLLFLEVGESSSWKLKNREPDSVQEIMQNCNCSTCKYVFLMFDYAYLQLIGHNDNEADPGRGYNWFALKWFFEEYFGIEEYKLFYDAVTEYISKVDSYIGYATIKTLIPSSLINFRKVVERSLVKYHYNDLLSLKYNGVELQKIDFLKIRKQFLDDKTLLTLLGTCDFAESMITAEWLNDSMTKAKAIDLTVIGTGYFKAVEQLLFELICLHKNTGIRIRKIKSKDDVILNDENIKAKVVDTTLGSMAICIKNNFKAIFRKDISIDAKRYVREAVFAYTELRNGYFHKDNIHEMKVIERIRDETFYMFFLLLGAFELSESSLIVLGFPEFVQTDFYRLCEYINYHNGLLFCLKVSEGNELYGIAHPDLNASIIENRYIRYSGLYFNINGRVFRFTETNLPREIYLAKFDIERTEHVSFEPEKVKIIFMNGKYVGPSIAQENEFGY